MTDPKPPAFRQSVPLSAPASVWSARPWVDGMDWTMRNSPSVCVIG